MNKYLIKNHFLTLLNSLKYPNAQGIITKTSRNLRTLSIGYNTKETHFVMSDFIRQSKKLRSNVIEKVEMDIALYSLKAIITREKSTRNNRLDHSFFIRNVFSSYAYESVIPLQSPRIDFAAKDKENPRIFHRKNLNFLRNKPLPLSKITFIFITGNILAGHNVDDILYAEGEKILPELETFFQHPKKSKF